MGVPEGGGVLAQEMAVAEAWLPGGMDSISIRGWSGGVACGVLSRKQSGMCILVACRGGGVEGEELDPNLLPFVTLLFFSCDLFICQLGTKTTCSASYGKEKPQLQTNWRQGKSHQPKSLW